ncbi:hypothetical protein H4R26_000660 [Coemansia thaxteri]|uniref:Uncharacterized protein n=1 Tax=Coemansia thaxteri TaxID=2663907 RepID=A0A9W8BNH3_9FUNG|nr:hypothetical protein H4R26_000660 [Coemansia thaxteri]
MAPVLGIVIFLPLVFTVIAQIIWRFRSSEFIYCWIPRTPVYARWLAVDGWRLLIIIGIILAYTRIAYLFYSARKAHRQQRYWEASPDQPLPRRYSAIDSAPVSNITTDGRGLFSQSMYNIHRWAWSKLGISSHTAATVVGGGDALPHPDGASIRRQCNPSFNEPKRNSVALGMAKASRNYYETFKRSFVLNIVRRFFLTVDIPSPTIPESIFDQIGREEDVRPEEILSVTHCDMPSSLHSTTESPADGCSTAPHYLASSSLNVAGDQEPDGRQTLKRWYSAVSRLVSTKRSQHALRAPPLHHPLRRSHTAPVLNLDGMGLCNCVFRRPHQTPATAQYAPHQAPSLATHGHSTPCTQCNNELQARPAASRTFSVKRRHADVSIDSFDYQTDKIRQIFGSTLDHNANRRVQIYTAHEESSSIYSDESSAQIVQVEAVEKLVSLEDGHWAKVVEQCRGERAAVASDPSVDREPGDSLGKRRFISRLYVYPLAYLLIWTPSIFYYFLSTYVYYTGFQSSKSLVHRRSLDMSHLPAHWTSGQNMNRAWPIYQRLTTDVWGSNQLGWLAIIQALHMLSGAVDAVLFWLTE